MNATSRRFLLGVVAGSVVWGGTCVAQEPESRPGGGDVAANLALLEELERDVTDPANHAAALVKLKRAQAVQDAMGSEYRKRVSGAYDKLDNYELKKVVDAARSTQDPVARLAAYDAALGEFSKRFDCYGCRANYETIALYKEMIAESDKLAERIETPEFEAEVPQRDMLFPKERGGWERSLAGADMNFVARELELKGVAVEGKKILGVVSCAGWKPAWHDLVLDMNFTIVAGEFQLYTRYWPDKRSYILDFGPRTGYELNKPYQITIRIKGSTIELLQPGQPAQSDVMSANTSRTGGFAFVLPPGTTVIVSKCSVKVLR